MQKRLDNKFNKFLWVLAISVLSILLVASCFAISGCQKNDEKKYPDPEPVKNGDFDYTFEVCDLGADGNIYLNIWGDNFAALGFSYGDSLNFCINDGKTYSDVPYFSGSFATEYPLSICDYPGDMYTWIIRKEDPIGWSDGLQRGDKVRIWRNIEGKYYKTQFQYSYKPSSNRDDYESDEQFANFRKVKTGEIGDNALVRSSSPVCTKYYRDQYALKLMNESKVNCWLDLYASNNTINKVLDNYKNDYRAQNAIKLNKEGKIINLSVNANYTIVEAFEEFAIKLGSMSEFEGPYLFTCQDGVDFTGLACLICECLCKSTYQEMRDDFMKSYDDLYGLNEQSNKELYDYVVKEDFDVPLAYLTGVDVSELKNCNPNTFYTLMRDRLNNLGMSDAQINEFIKNLKKNY